MGRQERIAAAIRRLDRAEVQRDEEALRFLLEDRRGRWMLMRLYERCHVEQAFRSGKVEDVLIEEGERRVALHLNAAIKTLGEDAAELLNRARMEYAEHRKRRTQAVEQAGGNEDELDF